MKTHLGQVLHPGDTALGYDLSTANLVDPELERCANKGMTVPDVVLVRASASSFSMLVAHLLIAHALSLSATLQSSADSAMGLTNLAERFLI